MRFVESVEQAKTRQFCFQNSERDPELQETIFTGTPEDLQLNIESVVVGADLSKIPDCPKGLVLTNNHAEGMFDRVAPFVQSIGAFNVGMREAAFASGGV